MPLAVAAVCPHPPLIVPEVATGAAAELDELRAACAAAVGRLLAAEPDRIIVVGDSPFTTTYVPGHRGSLARFGVPLTVALPGGAAAPGSPADLPLSLTIGAWLLTRAGAAGPVSGLGVSAGESPATCAELGRRLCAPEPGGERVALLVMGDATAGGDEQGSGYLDPRAERFDTAVTRAFAEADPAALLALDASEAAGLLAAGRAAWQVLAGAALADDPVPAGVPAGTPVAVRPVTGGTRPDPRGREVPAGTGAGSAARWRGSVGYAGAPYGVTYLVAVWEPACRD